VPKGRQASILERLLSRLRGGEPTPPPAIRQPSRPFQAISIYRGVDACQLARKYSDHRFLTKNAPKLPLPGCTMSKDCACRYVKHSDRRGESRRLVDFGASSMLTLFDGKERRGIRNGRRTRDQ
jgi:hypothetical protein